MNAIDVLTNEHRTVESILDQLCVFAGTTLEDKADRREMLAQFVALLRLFDDLHHMKEEDMLFERMIANGFPREQGPLAVMLSDHSTCRTLVGRLDSLASQDRPWTDEDRRVLDATSREYAAFLKDHIAKEDNVLYPMSRRQLPESEWARLDKAFGEFEARWRRDGRLDEFTRRVGELREAWPATPR
jgi:hemerythrin-like domain-containing protein